jgi:hypothetical protein
MAPCDRRHREKSPCRQLLHYGTTLARPVSHTTNVESIEHGVVVKHLATLRGRSGSYQRDADGNQVRSGVVFGRRQAIVGGWPAETRSTR